ncbi:hypothetical protein [Mycobacterium kyogaense]|uniref:hypothetical protein n=1 Tax=Mycobacterium kyogaense TaxID=2212479 RepID=UPI0013C50AFD|nr:hypothetical protein [Mycobacterium kyogaense]
MTSRIRRVVRRSYRDDLPNDRLVISVVGMSLTVRFPANNLAGIATLLRLYLVLAVLTLVALLVLSLVDPVAAPQTAWVHAVIVAGFAALLPIRLRSASRGSVAALRAVGLIAATVFLVNVVEALWPGFVPMWMRSEMWVIAALMLGVIALVIRERL